MRNTVLLAAALTLVSPAALARAADPSSCQVCAAADGATCKACAKQTSEQTAASSAAKRAGNWLIEETENFSICWPVGYKIKPGLAESCEALRRDLRGTWSSSEDDGRWNPRCHVVIHSTLGSYLKEVGAGAKQTTGSSLIDFDKDRVAMRRIDIRGDRADWYAEAFPHELTHVVLADRFIHVQIPHWADEGMAILADPVAKRRLHGKDLRTAIAAGSEFRLAELLTLDNYPHPARMGTFYGQSASLVEFLTSLGSRDQLVSFVDQATANGYDRALRDVYSIADVRALELKWRRHLREGSAAAENVSLKMNDAPARQTAARGNSDRLAVDDAGRAWATME